ncbi:hypothetical protein [Cellulomonas cellasea]|uniref:Uncharacterized protein n=1 Tax=Cellulomonas cellasea TaxID=43670 RepID=A0A7W4YCB2_9CELL|nr:hypothetical protein [Cellulomonas cellasea]MBB2923381.1 hypothetical protein [Cellulomonas cellasea]
MSTDDAFTRHLREVAGTAPRVAVDHRAVLASGRRRRLARAGGVTVGTLVLVLAVALGVSALPGPGEAALPAGPTPGEPTAAASASAAGPTADAAPAFPVVDVGAGTVRRPLDDWLLDETEQSLLQGAADHSADACLEAAGYGEHSSFSGLPPTRRGFVDYGVWRSADVEARGYQDLVVEFDEPVARGDRPAPTEEFYAASRACFGAARDQGLMYDPADFEQLAPEGWTSALRTDAGRAVAAEWAACLAEQGVSTPPVDDGVMVPVGVLDAPLDEQVRIGLLDVACKEQLDVVRRLASIDADQQLAYIERARPYLEALRPVQQAALAKARAYLTEAGVAIPEP